jgi:hypothetical protein
MDRRILSGLAAKAIPAVALLALLAAPAAAADPANLGCPAASLSEAQRTAITRSVLTGGLDVTERDAVVAAVDRCGEQFGWPVSARELAFRHSLSLIPLGEVRARLAAAEVNVAELERRVLADAALIEASRSDRFPEAELLAFLGRMEPALRARIDDPATPESLRSDIGALVILVAMAEASRRNFADR